MSLKEELTISKLDLFPNPVENELFLSNSVGIKEIMIFNHVGQQICTYTFNGTDLNVNIDVPELNTGIYYVQCIDSKGSLSLNKLSIR